MGCFFSCFRAGTDRSRDLRDPLVRDSRLGEAFLNDETKLGVRGTLEEDSGDGGGVDEELRREANYLKACGTILQTPPEIIEASRPVSSEDTNECNNASTNLEVMNETTLQNGNLTEVFNSGEHDILKHEQNIDEGTLRLEPETRPSVQEKPSFQNVDSKRADSADSPYPTPLVLKGDIETPGTVYSVYKGTSKRARASRQFVYPVLRPIENSLQWMELKEDSPVLSNPPKRRYMSADLSEKSKQKTLASTTGTQTETSKYVSFPFHDSISPEEAKGQNGDQQLLEDGQLFKQNSELGKHGVSSLSHWLRPSSADVDSSNDTDGNIGKGPCYEKSVFVFGASSLNWDNDNPTPVLPKAWDGNGIPNTTTKYKEDQKVNWHATPFEERLLKVLSDEKPRHQRNISGKLIHLEENAE